MQGQRKLKKESENKENEIESNKDDYTFNGGAQIFS
jgi:hypothetical protein